VAAGRQLPVQHCSRVHGTKSTASASRRAEGDATPRVHAWLESCNRISADLHPRPVSDDSVSMTGQTHVTTARVSGSSLVLCWTTTLGRPHKTDTNAVKGRVDSFGLCEKHAIRTHRPRSLGAWTTVDHPMEAQQLRFIADSHSDGLTCPVAKGRSTQVRVRFTITSMHDSRSCGCFGLV